MAASRTVDPSGKYRSTAMVSLRLTTIQMENIAELCKERGIGRSKLFRQLLAEEWARVEGTR
jgi:hypothetical protein